MQSQKKSFGHTFEKWKLYFNQAPKESLNVNVSNLEDNFQTIVCIIICFIVFLQPP